MFGLHSVVAAVSSVGRLTVIRRLELMESIARWLAGPLPLITAARLIGRLRARIVVHPRILLRLLDVSVGIIEVPVLVGRLIGRLPIELPALICVDGCGSRNSRRQPSHDGPLREGHGGFSSAYSGICGDVTRASGCDGCRFDRMHSLDLVRGYTNCCPAHGPCADEGFARDGRNCSCVSRVGVVVDDGRIAVKDGGVLDIGYLRDIYKA